MDKNILIEIIRVSKKYSFLNGRNNDSATDFYALKNISLDILKGEVVGITGPNGSGKSTLLKLLSGISKPTEGTIKIKGKVGSILELGAGFNLELSGKENIFLYGILLGASKKEIEQKIDEIIAFSEIENFIHQPVKTYSSGMYLRLAFSIMVHLDCDIYLLDEVLAVGDQYFTEKALTILRKKIESGITAIIVSHNTEFLLNICTRILQISDGQIIDNNNATFVFNETAYFRLDQKIRLDEIKHVETKEEITFFLSFSNINQKETLDIGLSFDYNHSIQSRFVISSIDSVKSITPSGIDTELNVTFSIEKRNLKAGEYSISVFLIKEKKNITKSFISCYILKLESEKIDLLEIYPNPLKLFVEWKYN